MLKFNCTLYELSDKVDFKAYKCNDVNYIILYTNNHILKLRGKIVKYLYLLLDYRTHIVQNIDIISLFYKYGWIQKVEVMNPIKWQISNYSYLLKDNEEFYVMNFLYRTIDTIDRRTYISLKDNSYENISQDLLLNLYLRKYLKMHNNEDYSKYITESNFKIIYILYSYNCNMRCIYCYEKKYNRNKSITEKILTAQESYINNMIKSNNNILLVLFGGEPLLKDNKIYINNIVSKYRNYGNVHFQIITNGINIEQYIDVLIAIQEKLYCIVITIDGTKEIHDSRRILNNKDGTFYQVIKSINLLVNEKIYVKIRVNLDDENINDQENLAHYLNNNIKDLNYISMEYYRVENKEDYNFRPLDLYTCYCLSERIKSISNFKVTCGFPFSWVFEDWLNLNDFRPYIAKEFCPISATSVLDIDGHIYCCNEAMGNKDFCIGNYLDNNWIVKDNFVIKNECKKCEFYLLCYGGCQYANSMLPFKCPKKQFVKIVMEFVRNNKDKLLNKSIVNI